MADVEHRPWDAVSCAYSILLTMSKLPFPLENINLPWVVSSKVSSPQQTPTETCSVTLTQMQEYSPLSLTDPDDSESRSRTIVCDPSGASYGSSVWAIASS